MLFWSALINFPENKHTKCLHNLYKLHGDFSFPSDESLLELTFSRFLLIYLDDYQKRSIFFIYLKTNLLYL